MKKHIIPYLTLSITAGLALMLPLSTFAADDNPNDAKLQKNGGHAAAAAGPAHASKPVAHAAAAPTHVVQQQPVNTAARHTATTHANAKPAAVTQPANAQVAQQSHTRNVRTSTASQPAATQPAVAQARGAHAGRASTTINQTQVVVAPNGGGQYTRANSYGGRWTAGNNHTDWNQGQEHNWDGHQYRWYDGGWLIIDGGFWPVPGGYQGGSSVMAGAQQQLANDGYYNGAIDGVPGPATRQAIANFQSDNNLPVTGHLNEPTRQSLGLD